MRSSDWKPIDTAPEYEAVLIAGGDVLYPIVASKNEGRWDLDAQGAIVEDDIAQSPTHWMPIDAIWALADNYNTNLNLWIEATRIPKWLEGLRAWVWDSNKESSAVVPGIVPRGYSRDPRHCGGIWYQLMAPPAPPRGGA